MSRASLDGQKKKVVIVGDGAIGKTALLMVQTGLPYPDVYTPTIFDSFTTKVKVPGNKEVELVLWDTAGQEDYDRLRPLSYPDTDVLIISFAICNPDSLNNLTEKWLPETKHFLPTTPSILVGMKRDLRSDPFVVGELAKINQHPVTPEEGLEAMTKIGAVKYLECSAKTGEGVQEVFQAAAKLAVYPKNKLTKCKMV
ncbi:putative guanine nucleotide regulatory protein [Globomyces pollinis-pini]|nr:putative guanine nucleotide regulatory protein [Globomyces pollinis-pini]